jgi:hypothetical protein
MCDTPTLSLAGRDIIIIIPDFDGLVLPAAFLPG